MINQQTNLLQLDFTDILLHCDIQSVNFLFGQGDNPSDLFQYIGFGKGEETENRQYNRWGKMQRFQAHSSLLDTGSVQHVRQGCNLGFKCFGFGEELLFSLHCACVSSDV